MFVGVYDKLERAEYFLNNIKALASSAGGFGRQDIRGNLDAFFFEVVSAKDFFLQGINDKYKLNISSRDATTISKLKSAVRDPAVLAVIQSIEAQLSNTQSWLWKLNNYRNSASHRELVHVGYELILPQQPNAKTYLFEDPDGKSQGNAKTEVIPYCEQSLGSMRDFLEKLYSQLP